MHPTPYLQLLASIFLIGLGLVLVRRSLSDRTARRRLRDAMHRGERRPCNVIIPTRFPRGYVVTSAKTRPLRSTLTRGHALLDALIVLLFCTCIAAVVLVCLSDIDLVAR